MAVRESVLTTRPVVSDKALSLWLCRKEFPQRQQVGNKCLLVGKSIVSIERHMGGLRERVVPSE